MRTRSIGLAQARSMLQVLQWLSDQLSKQHNIQSMPFWIKTTLSTYIPQWVHAVESKDAALEQDCFKGISSKLAQLLAKHGISDPGSLADQYTKQLLERFQQIYRDP